MCLVSMILILVCQTLQDIVNSNTHDSHDFQTGLASFESFFLELFGLEFAVLSRDSHILNIFEYCILTCYADAVFVIRKAPKLRAGLVACEGSGSIDL